MIELGGDADLAGEPVGPEHRSQLGPEHLDRDLAVMPQIVGEIDRGHPAVAQLALDPVAARERGREMC